MMVMIAQVTNPPRTVKPQPTVPPKIRSTSIREIRSLLITMSLKGVSYFTMMSNTVLKSASTTAVKTRIPNTMNKYNPNTKLIEPSSNFS